MTEEPPPDGAVAVVEAAWTPGRAAPDHRSEMTTQWLCGQLLEVLEEEGKWIRVRGPDGYESWAGRGPVLRLSGAEADAWREEATTLSLGARLEVGDRPRSDGSRGVVPRLLPWGARVAREGPGRVRLPGGALARPVSPDRLVEAADARRRFPADPAAVVATGLLWMGAPYLWGGRTPDGTDCSGLVQAVHALHGVRLPRDSGQQLAAGPEVPAPDLSAGGGAAGGAGEAGRAGGSGREGDGGSGGARSPRPGDLLFFGDDRESVSHVVMVVEGHTVLHAAEDNGAVAVDDLAGDGPLARSLRPRAVGATRPFAAG